MSIAEATPVRSGLREWPHRLMKPFLRRRVTRRWDVNVRGMGYLPGSGPAIIVSNHIGWLDGPVTVATADRTVHALVKAESFDGKAGRFLRWAAQIKLHRGRTDAAAVRTALRVLRAGQVLLLYPEGRRGAGTVEEVFDGAGYLALTTGAPVVPVAVVGTREPGAAVDVKPPKGSRIDIVYGDQIHISPLDWPRDSWQVAKASDQIARALRQHVEDTLDRLKRELPGPPPVPDLVEEEPVEEEPVEEEIVEEEVVDEEPAADEGAEETTDEADEPEEPAEDADADTEETADSDEEPEPEEPEQADDEPDTEDEPEEPAEDADASDDAEPESEETDEPDPDTDADDENTDDTDDQGSDKSA
ncbi:MAG: lysophospholipid acyltransferase family protein [Aeromicrobium sp.]|uniref:lysophospholipid acyltransferase family protein n=1 Tax=Aeromicrobium sp. TaxID=1871063 RepID=UPI0039E396C2